jgi:hypothetical protein
MEQNIAGGGGGNPDSGAPGHQRSDTCTVHRHNIQPHVK